MKRNKKAFKIVGITIGAVLFLYLSIVMTLVVAAGNGNFKVVNKMLNMGINPDSKGLGSKTPLMEAVDNGQLRMVKLLIEHKANVNAVNQDGWTPLLFASDNGNEFVLQALLEAGANVNSSDKDGFTPVMWAASEGHEKVVEQLIKHNADVNVKCQYLLFKGYTPLLFAIDENSYTICEMLIGAGANTNKSDASGWLPIQAAASKGNLEIVKLLVEKGAYYNLNSSDSPVQLASEHGYKDVFNYLNNRLPVNQ